MHKKILYVSTFLNVALIVSLAALLVAGNPSNKFKSESTDLNSLEETSSKDLFEEVQARVNSASFSGLSNSQSKMLRLQELKQEYLNTILPPADYYWTATPFKETADFLLMQLEGFKKIREDLIAEFGEEAKNSLEFKEVFQPLATQHSYLPSEQQIALREYQIKNQIQFLSNPNMPPVGSGAQVRMMASPMRHDGGLETILSPDMLFEYNLRTSPLSNRLRNVDLSFTEQEFRGVYEIFENFTPKAVTPSPDQHDLLASDLESLLGQARTTKLLANLDPNFEAIKVAGEKNRLSEQQIYSAYEIFSQTDREVIEAYSSRKESPVESGLKIQTTMKERTDNLNALLGEQVAQDMLQMRQEFQERSSGSNRSNRKPIFN